MPDVTIYDIAKRAGVSAATVSRVINHYPHVKQSTREKIEALLSEANYVPNETARGLVNQASKLIAILITDIRTTQHTDGIYYMQREFATRGYACIILNTGRSIEEKVASIQLVCKRKVDAVVLMGSAFQTEDIKNALELYLTGVPIAFCNGYLDLPNVYSIIADEKGGVREAVAFLRNKKREKIAFIVNVDTASNRLKEEGYREGMRVSCPDFAPVVAWTGDTLREMQECILGLLKQCPDMQGIIFAEDQLAFMGLHVLQVLGKSVPGEIAVIGINNSKLAEFSLPTLTSLDNSLKEMSMAAVRCIIDSFEGEQAPRKNLIPITLVEREST